MSILEYHPPPRKQVIKDDTPVAPPRAKAFKRLDQIRNTLLLSDPEYLLEGYVEKEIFAVGEVTNVPTSIDISNRMEVLKVIDEARRCKILPWKVSQKHVSTLSLSVQNVKLISIKGKVLIRLSINEIASVCYIQDDEEHLIVIKRGNLEKTVCSLVVLNCTKTKDAEEICLILEQIFQLVYTEATMAHLDAAIDSGSQEPEDNIIMSKYNEETDSRVSDNVMEPDSNSHIQQLFSDEPRELDIEHDDINMAAEEIVQNYMDNLHKKLSSEELRQFAMLLREYRADLPVHDFCNKLLNLYGQKRLFLMPGMRAFVPEEDKLFFEAFLVDCGAAKFKIKSKVENKNIEDR